MLEERVAERTLALASTNAAIQRFVPREFLHALGHDDVTTTKLGDATAKSITVLFADIRNFTAYSEGMTPEETFAFLNGCLSKLGPHVRAQSGFVDKYIGDAIMALFPRDPSDAVRAAIAMQDEAHRSNDAFVGREPLAIGVGIHVGNVMMGTIGEAERFEATVISDAVNLTARLESLTKQLGCSVLISEDVFATLDESSRTFTRRLGTFVVKGRAQPVALYEVFASDSDALRDSKAQTRARFDEMLGAFADERIDAALAIASGLRDACPEDGPANWWFMRLVRESASGDDAVPSSRGIVRLDEK
jgi:two-component system sensor histidine kinase ChiS